MHNMGPVKIEAAGSSPATNASPESRVGENEQAVPSGDAVRLDQDQVDRISRAIDGGAENIHDICPLSPLQQGMLFHHLIDQHADSYVQSILFELQSPADIPRLAQSLQKTIDRHDALRSAVLWEGLQRPVQVVHRRARLSIVEQVLDTQDDPLEQLRQRLRLGSQNLDLRKAPLLQLEVVRTAQGQRRHAILHVHHLVCDHQSLRLLVAEAMTFAAGREHELPLPGALRDHLTVPPAESTQTEQFFRSKLADVEEPTATFGLVDSGTQASIVDEFGEHLDTALSLRIRNQARRAGTTTARLFHAAWAMVLANISGRDDVVFGTVLSTARPRHAQVLPTLGMFVNTLPLRLQLANHTAEQLVKTAHGEIEALLQHAQASLAVVQRCSGLPAGAPLLTSILNYRHSASGPHSDLSAAAGIRLIERVDASTTYPIAVTVENLGNEFSFVVQTDRRISARRVVAYLRTALQSLVGALEHEPCRRVSQLQVLPDAERRELMESFNNTRAAYPHQQPVHKLFEAQARLQPDAVAVVCGGRQLTYAQLDSRANRLANLLVSHGVAPDRLVALYLDRGLEMAVGLLGILKAGGAYVPIDVSYPAERVRYMLEDSAPIVVLTQGRQRHRLPPSSALIIALDDTDESLWRDVRAESPTAPDDGLRPQHLAYVIYTSGSSGAPKGVMIEHRNLTNLVLWTCSAFDLQPGVRSSMVAALGFDAATWEFWAPLSVGATLTLAPPETQRDVDALFRWWLEEPIDTSFMPTPMAEFAFSRGVHKPHLRIMHVGGDRLRQRPSTQSFALVNNYGPTETTVVATSGRIERDDAVLHIGRPIANTQLYVLNQWQYPAPVGVTGEIYVGGAGVARGYLNRPKLTAERFLPDPFSDEQHARLYRTGDLGRWRSDGTIEYLGRNDDQVKIRGLRIELGEIEIQLTQSGQAKEALVLARDLDGEQRLVAYVTPGDASSASADQQIAGMRAYLKTVVPEYMVPSAFIVLERLPLTANGKVDYRALPIPEFDSSAGRIHEAPHGEVEQILAGIWQKLLHVGRVGRHDNFFELGGHSLLIVEMLEELRRFGLSTDVRRVFESATLAQMAAGLSDTSREQFEVLPKTVPAGCTAITPDMLPLVELEAEQIERIAQATSGGAANIQDIYPLTPLQEGMLFHHLLNEEGGDAYVIAMAASVQSRESLQQLIDALQATIDRHDVLRTAVLWEQLPRPVQVVYRRARLPISDVVLDASRDSADQVMEWLRPERQRMNLRSAPLLQLQVAQDPTNARCHVLLQLHHLIMDGASLEMMIDEVAAQLHGHGELLPPAVPYRNHVARVLTHGAMHAAESFFREKLAEVDETTAAFGLADTHAAATHIDETRIECDLSLARRLRTQARRLNVSAASLFHAACGLVVARISGRDDVVLGTVLSGRLQETQGAGRQLGLFINTLPMRLKLQGLNVMQLIHSTQRELVELLDHEHASLALAQRCSGVEGSGSLFSVLLNYRHSSAALAGSWSRAGVQYLGGRSGTNYPITISVDDLRGGFVVTVQTDRRIDSRRMTGYLSTALASLVDALESSQQTEALTLTVVPPGETHELTDELNATHSRYRKHSAVHELFERQVERTPESTAVCHGTQALTYCELNIKANQLARYLRTQGVGPTGLVAVCMERSVNMIVALLAILKAGAAYVPLDPDYPSSRLRHMVEDSSPCLLLTEEKLKTIMSSTGARILLLGEAPQVAGNSSENLSSDDVRVGAADLVYLIYTSGSTGRPKGTAMPHGAMVNLIGWHRAAFGAALAPRVLQFAALSFDVAFQEIFSTLCTGGRLELLDGWVRKDARALLELLTDRGIERLFVPPLMLQSIAEAVKATGIVPQQLKDVITAGEQLRVTPEIISFFERTGGRLHNHYGPTETHVVTALTLPGRPATWPALPTIGAPIANTQIYILDKRMQLVPRGAFGEIVIGGANVAHGYLHQRALTAERFVCDPFSEGQRLYRTGDLGRWREDGTIEYLGRNDHQVKIRGFRIELGEIEAQLSRHAQVKEVAVIVREDTPGEKRLVAYVTLRDSALAPGVEEFRAFIKALVPEHMVPSAFVALARLPLTPSGKLDRRSLPKPELDAYTRRRYEPPQGDVEEILAGIWQGLLGVAPVGRHDNFFELGGHSLLIVQMIERLRRLGLSIRARRVFDSASLADLALELTRRTNEWQQAPQNAIPIGCEFITPQMLPLVQLTAAQIERIVQAVPGGAAGIQDIYPLAPLQEGMLFHHRLNDKGGDVYVRQMLLSLCREEQLGELIRALQALVDRHDALRAAVVWDHVPRPVQVVQRHAELPVEEVALDPARDCVEQVITWLEPERQRFDLRRAPLLRVRVAKDPHGSTVYVLIQTHHLVCDNQSLKVIVEEIAAHMQGRAHDLSVPVSYREHVIQVLAEARTQDAETFFRGKLSDVTEPSAPFDLLNVHEGSRRLAQARQELDKSVSQRLRAQARRLCVSSATMFHAAWALVIARTTGRDDVVYGTVLLGRMHGKVDAQRTVGMFINTLPLRLRLNEVTARELVENTQRELVELLDHEQAPLAVVQRCSGIAGTTPLFSTLLNYLHGAVDPGDQFARVPGMSLLAITGETNYPIVLSVHDDADGFAIEMKTDGCIDPHRMLEYICTATVSLIEALESSPKTPALLLPILPDSERRQILEGFNAAAATYAQDRLIHQLFEERAARAPDAIAVTCEEQTLTYGHLNDRANRLARFLRSRGVARDQLVGICLERGLDLVVGLLGILKAGGAYVPLDPSYPSDRLKHMLDDSAPRVVLTQAALRDALPVSGAEVVTLDEDWGEIEALPASDLSSSGFEPRQLAYVIYTSGSTGKPKGVMVEHGNVVRLFRATDHWFGFDQKDVWTMFHSVAFDFSVWELWGALLSGGRVVVVPYTIARSPLDFYRLVCAQGVTVLNQTPSAFTQFIDAQASVSHLRHSLRWVIFGGEALELRALRKWVERNGAEHPKLVNMYGITETTVHVTYASLSAQDIESEHSSPIGVPIPDLRLYLLDRQRQLAPIGVTGEIFVGGAGVARGYLNRPELTAERFTDDPFIATQDARLYKSGDLARWRADGTLEYLGRNDAQVKLRGFRIELGEIEAQLARHPQVKEAVVIAREDVPGEKRLVAYIVSQPLESMPPLGAESLRSHLSAVLPDYMVPNAYVLLERLPLTSNGKLDRRGLPAPVLDAYATQQYEAPEGEMEQMLAEIWQELLRAPRVGRDDDFFLLGGHSLSAMQAIARIGSLLSIEVPVSVLFQYPRMKDLAAQLEELRRARLLETLADPDADLAVLLAEIGSLTHDEVRLRLRELRQDARL